MWSCWPREMDSSRFARNEWTTFGAVEVVMPMVDVFIVGAPKCGTTALFKYLGEHPSIFTPDFVRGNTGKTEANHFAREFQREDDPMRDRAYYLSFFQSAREDQLACDASVYHLYSPSAANEIFKYNPEARIIVMLRKPSAFMFSYYQEMRFHGLESCADFSEALRREDERADTRLRYRHLARYSEHLKKYLDVFPRDKVLLIQFEDFFDDPKAGYKRVVDFLNVPEWYPATFTRVNPSKKARYQALHQVIYHPPRRIVASIKRLIGEQRAVWLAHRLVLLSRSFNTTRARSSMSAELEAALDAEFEPEVARLENLTGLDLRGWKPTKG